MIFLFYICGTLIMRSDIMFKYPSNIVFLYYSDMEYGSKFIESTFGLPLIMDQGFAKVYQINSTSFLGIVQLKEPKIYTGSTLLSFNTENIKEEYSRVSKLEIYKCTSIQRIDQIPLDSFFFQDKEGHDFEIQEFLNKEQDCVFYND